MIALFLGLALLTQEAQPPSPTPQPAAAQEAAPSPTEPFPARTPDPVERPPATTQEPPPAKARPAPAPAAPGRPPAPRPVVQPDHCLSRTYTDAHPEACLGPADEPTAKADPAQEKRAAPTTPPASPTPPPARADAKAPPVAEEPALLTRLPVLIALGVVAVLLLLAVVVLILRLRGGGSPAGLREVELAGPSGAVLLTPAQLARGAQGPGKSRWSVRDGRLILTGPTGTLLNGVPLDRAGDIVSTGDTVRLGGAEYRIRII